MQLTLCFATLLLLAQLPAGTQNDPGAAAAAPMADPALPAVLLGEPPDGPQPASPTRAAEPRGRFAPQSLPATPGVPPQSAPPRTTRAEPPGIDSAAVPSVLLGEPERRGREREGPPTARLEAPEIVSAEPRQPKAKAALLLDSMLSLPAELKPAGRATTLVEVLAVTSDRQQQAELTAAYWKLSVALAHYRLAAEEARWLDQIAAEVPGAAGQEHERLSARLVWSHALEESAARLQAAEQKLLTAQYELAQRTRLPLEAPYPLPADKPHVGTYTTYFAQIYAGRTDNAQACTIDRLLPLRREALEARARRVQAAHDVVEASREALRENREPASRLLADLEELRGERDAFLADVLQYNEDIAAYALAVPRGDLSSEEVAGMLIKRDALPVARAPGVPMAGSPSPISAATFNAPIPEIPQAASGRREGEPTLAPPRGGAMPARTEPEPRGPADFGPHEALRPGEFGEAPRTVQSQGLYVALLEVSPAKRTQELANLLHWERNLPADAAARVTLPECLVSVPEFERRGVIAAYWRAREDAAQYQRIVYQLEQLTALQPSMFRLRQAAGGPEAMLRLRSARMGLEVELAETRVALAIHQSQLTQLAHRPLDSAWLLPTTSPHGGGYRLKAGAAIGPTPQSFALRRAAAVLPATHRTLIAQAHTVVLADARRALACAEFETGSADVQKLLAALETEADETRGFLSTLTEYNLEIADYALAMLPPAAPTDVLTGALVTRTTP